MKKAIIVIGLLAILMAVSVSAGKTADAWYARPQGQTSVLQGCVDFPCFINEAAQREGHRYDWGPHYYHWLDKRAKSANFIKFGAPVERYFGIE